MSLSAWDRRTRHSRGLTLPWRKLGLRISPGWYGIETGRRFCSEDHKQQLWWCRVRVALSDTRGLFHWMPCKWAAQVCTGSSTWQVASEGREALVWCDVIGLYADQYTCCIIFHALESLHLCCWYAEKMGFTIVQSRRYEAMHQCLSCLSCEIVPHVCNVPELGEGCMIDKTFECDGPCWVLGLW